MALVALLLSAPASAESKSLHIGPHPAREVKRWIWRHRVTPFHYGGHWWAAPYPIALCESGGNYFVGPSGAYGLIPPLPQYMSPREQDETAYRLYEEYGEAPWAPYEASCIYR